MNSPITTLELVREAKAALEHSIIPYPARQSILQTRLVIAQRVDQALAYLRAAEISLAPPVVAKPGARKRTNIVSEGGFGFVPLMMLVTLLGSIHIVGPTIHCLSSHHLVTCPQKIQSALTAKRAVPPLPSSVVFVERVLRIAAIETGISHALLHAFAFRESAPNSSAVSLADSTYAATRVQSQRNASSTAK